VHFGSIKKVGAAAALFILAGCRSGPPRATSIGEAYVGPATLKIRGDIPLQSSTVATVKHGDRLEILGSRRRFLRVRTPQGAEGWTDERQLLAPADMASLKELADRAAKMPVQGVATTYSDVNVHTQPARQSPSFLQVKEKEKMDVLIHVVTPRADAPRKPLIAPPPKKKSRTVEKKQARKEPKFPQPPMPKPPAPPAGWLDLSRTDLSDEAAAPDDEPETKPAAPTDDWSLIRTATGQSGWVMTRRLVMAIPDEVAQYAEGRRIVSYFSLGEIRDGDQKKNIWLWTTTSDSSQPYDFDSFRVFVWSLRHHRYETGYIERKLKGYAPVTLKEVDFSSKTQAAKYPGFSICLEKKDGQRYRREYALLTNVIRFAGEYPCEAPAPPVTVKAPAVLPNQNPGPAPQPGSPSFGERLKQHWRALTGSEPRHDR
jgi:SH3-like domain-containing protein